jgi:putative NADH-flavin reductase
MKIVILGAAGRTGKHLVEKALVGGHEVTAFIRPAEQLESTAKVRIVTGDARSEQDLTKALEGQQAVVSALGSTKLKDDLTVRSTQALIAAAHKTGVKRVIMMSTFLLTPNYKPNFLGKLFNSAAQGMLADKTNGEEILKASNLDWTIVYATILDAAKPGGKVRIVQSNETVGMSNGISRADVADFLIKTISQPEYIHKSMLITVK